MARTKASQPRTLMLHCYRPVESLELCSQEWVSQTATHSYKEDGQPLRNMFVQLFLCTTACPTLGSV
eukprot:711031-Amphidinium_carterae.1